jgi:hypothetical protein
MSKTSQERQEGTKELKEIQERALQRAAGMRPVHVGLGESPAVNFLLALEAFVGNFMADSKWVCVRT